MLPSAETNQHRHRCIPHLGVTHLKGGRPICFGQDSKLAGKLPELLWPPPVEAQSFWADIFHCCVFPLQLRDLVNQAKSDTRSEVQHGYGSVRTKLHSASKSAIIADRHSDSLITSRCECQISRDGLTCFTADPWDFPCETLLACAFSCLCWFCFDVRARIRPALL